MGRLLTAGAILGVGISVIAHAYPEGAPWGAADPSAAEHCASCHWERKPVMASQALRIDGLPRRVLPGQDYVLTLYLEGTEARISGFQVIASAGAFRSTDADVEVAPIEASIRSTAPRPTTGNVARWRFNWQAPAAMSAPLILHAAASAANDDGSPFGDQIHYRTLELEPVVVPGRKKGPPAPKD